uniref:Kielin cysteine rich BMP regulator n=1 Tax=Scleropages formosus TaxID=113540 RepID=A0A8C9W1R2_SCLFO
RPQEPNNNSEEDCIMAVNLGLCHAQNSELQTRVQYLESCECRRPTCFWEGQQLEDGARWEMGQRSACVCVAGKVQCAVSEGEWFCHWCVSTAPHFSETWPENFSFLKLRLLIDEFVHCSQEGRVQCEIDTCHIPCRNPASPPPGSCCPVCDGCSVNGVNYLSGDRVPSADHCQECTCLVSSVKLVNGNVHPSLSLFSLRLVCILEGMEFEEGTQWEPDSQPCSSCACINGEAVCQVSQCPPVSCSHPTRVDGLCCATCDRCTYKQRVFENGQEFADPESPCQWCTCQDGTVKCRKTQCPPVNCSSSPLAPAGQCCPQCPDCNFENRVFVDGEKFPSPVNPCQQCVCRGGLVDCQDHECQRPHCSYPLPGSCCQNNCNGCSYAGKEYPNGMEFAHPTDKCRTCHCVNGNVHCQMKRCPPLQCSEPSVTSGECCPMCPAPPADCLHAGQPYRHEQRFYDPTDECHTCVCSNGTVSCQRKPCGPVHCVHPILQDCCRTCDGCLYGDVEHSNGEAFTDPSDPCRVCTCREGTVTCELQRCPAVSCPFPVQGHCCQTCKGCSYVGKEYLNGQEFTDPREPCNLCSCVNGHVTCGRKPCYSPGCTHPITLPGSCCPVCDGCLYNSVTIADGQLFPDPRDPCSECTCWAGTVRCVKRVCPPATCSHPAADSCSCPVCDGCDFHGRDCRNGERFPDPKDKYPCQRCSCVRGSVACVPVVCPPAQCPRPVTKPDQCCPECQGCIYNGVARDEGSTWFADAMPCMSCMCVDGVTTCSEVHCVSPCLNQVHIPGECCPVCADCIYDNHVYGPGDSFHLSNDPCQVCTCEVMFNGEQHLRCYRKQCPSLVDCPKNNIIFSGPDPCCPVCAQPLSNCTTTLIGNEVHATDDPCFTCHCKDLTWTCIHQGCLPLSCPASEQFTPEGSCCPVCEECVIEGENRRVGNGETWMDSVDECITCTCNLGYIECNIEECAQITCQDGLVKMKSAGRCCYECQDPSVSCMYGGDAYLSNEHWEVDECTSCSCLSGEVHCQTERCPQVACASDETPALIPGMCCPHCIPRPATCVAFGDPHYRTFDGKMIHFQGTCTYVLTEDCEGGDFSIYATNDNRGRKGVSWTKEVTIFIGDVVVQLLQNWVVMVDYQTVDLPFLREPYIYVERKTNTVLLNTNIGVKVLWNGKSHLEVSVPGTYKNNMCGLCGNFNNYPQDDMRIRTGQIVQSEAAFGNSWKVGFLDGTGKNCHDAHDVDPCKEAGYSTRKAANARCGVLKSEAFEHCHRVVPPEMFFASCVYDLCACGSNVDDCLCDSLEAYASECREAGVILQWRSPGLCAVGCPLDRGFVFDECGPPCPKTCFNKDVPLGILEAHCFKPCVPGCQCPAGLVEHESHCIAPEACPRVIYGKVPLFAGY